MSSPPRDNNTEQQQPQASSSSAPPSETPLPSFASDSGEGTLNPRFLANSDGLPRHSPASRVSGGQTSFRLPTSSQPSMPALTTSTAGAIDASNPNGNNSNPGGANNNHAQGAPPPSANAPSSQINPTAFARQLQGDSGMLNGHGQQQQQQPQSNGQQQQQQQQQQAAPSAGLPPAGASPTAYPSLHLFPLNDTFVPKAIHMPPQSRIKIGRQTNTKSVPASHNGYFDSKVLSRTHAEVWFDPESPAGGPGVFIKDVGSSNGTFINGERLSGEGLRSDVFPLRDGDAVEFGIDIASEDGRTVVHHKVAAKVALALTADDADRISRSPAASFAAVRRMSRAPGVSSSGMSFDHILQRLQSELQRSREAGQDLHSASVTLHRAHEAIHGHLPPPSMPSYPHTLPPVAPPQQNFTAVQSQLSETQASLLTHSDRVKSLEETISNLKNEVERTKSEMEVLLTTSAKSQSDDHAHVQGSHQLHHALLTNGSSDRGESGAVEDDAASDAGSVASMDTVRHYAEEHDCALRDEQESLRTANAALLTRIEQLSTELHQANEISASLQTQHKSQADLLTGISDRLAALEQAPAPAPAAVAAAQSDGDDTKKEAEQPAAADSKAMDLAEQRWNAWKNAFESSWAQERSTWHGEKAKLEAKIAELEANSVRSSRRRKRGGKRRRDNDASGSSSESSTDEHSAARASTPSSIEVDKAGTSHNGSPTSSKGRGDGWPSGGQAGEDDASSKGGSRSARSVQTDRERTYDKSPFGRGSPTAVQTTVGAVSVVAVAFVAWAMVTGQTPKE